LPVGIYDKRNLMRILIVGAGPIGCYAAQLLKKIGYEPILLEEHPSVGKPVQCAGIVSSKLISTLKPFISESAIVNRINSFAINTPWTEEFYLNIPGVACILNREKFDLDIGQGLDIHLKSRVTKIEKEDSGYRVYTEKSESFLTDLLIGADGTDSIVRKYMFDNYVSKYKNNNNLKINYYYGMQYQIKLKEMYQGITNDSIQVYFDDNIPFFLWIILENSKTLRVGVVGTLPENAKKKLDEYLYRKKIKGEIVDVIAGKIAIGYIPTYYDNIALIGDAACQTKPLTGGGISYGIYSVRILIDCIKENKLEEYDWRWKKKFSKEIKFGLKARRMYEDLDNDNRVNLFHLFKKYSSFIEQVVEFDNHYSLFQAALNNPQILVDAGKLLGNYMKDMIK